MFKSESCSFYCLSLTLHLSVFSLQTTHLSNRKMHWPIPIINKIFKYWPLQYISLSLVTMLFSAKCLFNIMMHKFVFIIFRLGMSYISILSRLGGFEFIVTESAVLKLNLKKHMFNHASEENQPNNKCLNI